MSGERYVYALSDWTVEKRASGWYFSRSANRHRSADWRGPYSSEVSVALMIARQLRREIVECYQHQANGRAA
jgi:hypothetical protein